MEDKVLMLSQTCDNECELLVCDLSDLAAEYTLKLSDRTVVSKALPHQVLQRALYSWL